MQIRNEGNEQTAKINSIQTEMQPFVFDNSKLTNQVKRNKGVRLLMEKEEEAKEN